MKRSIFLLLVLTFFLSSSQALAYFDRRGVLSESTPSAKNKREEAKEKSREKLSEAKQKICLARHTAIRIRSLGVVARARGLNARVDAYVQAAKTFYTEKILPAGKVVENYDELILAMETKKEAAQTAFKEAEEAAKEFDCRGEDPKGKLAAFRTEMKEAFLAIKEYKASVKEFLKAVRIVAKEVRATSSAQTGE